MKTKNGIYNDLKESEYKIKIDNLIFYFSSLMYKEKFYDKWLEYLEEETFKINNKYGVNTNFNIMLLISLYKKIEKRGFRVYDINLSRELMESEEIKDMIL